MLSEGTHPDAPATDFAARRTQTLLEDARRHVSGEIERPAGARIAPELSIVSVGQAVRAGERTVRVPIVLGNANGQTSTLALTIQIDPVIDADDG